MCGFGRKWVTQKEVYNIKPFVLLKGHFHLIFVCDAKNKPLSWSLTPLIMLTLFLHARSTYSRYSSHDLFFLFFYFFLFLVTRALSLSLSISQKKNELDGDSEYNRGFKL